MRRSINCNADWTFIKPGEEPKQMNIPHTWNNIDGQDGGNDYWRGTCRYEKTFEMPSFDTKTEQVWLEFEGVNSSAKVTLNGAEVVTHEGGYSTFRVDVTDKLKASNALVVDVDNSINQEVYPQKADFTFYGGIYRDVKLLIVSKDHFALSYLGCSGVKVTPKVDEADHSTATVRVESNVEGSGITLIRLLDAAGDPVGEMRGNDVTFTVSHPHLWDGVKDPYLYTVEALLLDTKSVGKATTGVAADNAAAEEPKAKEVSKSAGTAESISDEAVLDRVVTKIGIRSFHIDAKKGFYLNGRPYPLHGVSRHQDRRGIGNAITKEMHEEDMALIKEVGANTIRLAHYQHDQYFYDLCDEAGMVVWAEIPYISEHLPFGRSNTISQMRELIAQNYNHASICVWGVSNEITISTKDKKDMLDNHHVLNDLCHEMDPNRLTTLACYAMCGPFNPVAHITDVVGWNLYLGWYVPGLFLNDLWIGFFHLVYPNRALCFSEYGAEGMPNLHSESPRRGDQTEEYQAKYHEFMLKCFARHPWMWGSYVWNMFDFAADARDQGGEPGMNHKGLVTFDRKTKKDSFYLYKAWWSDEAFVQIGSKRFTDRAKDTVTVTVYSNQKSVALYVNGEKVETKTGDKVFRFKVRLTDVTVVKAVAGDCSDQAVFKKVDKPNPAYKVAKSKKKSNWV